MIAALGRALLREDRDFHHHCQNFEAAVRLYSTWVLRRPHSRPGRDGRAICGAFPDRPRAGTDLEYSQPGLRRGDHLFEE